MPLGILESLQRLYGEKPVSSDARGRRAALPSEIQAVLGEIDENNWHEAVITTTPQAIAVQKDQDEAMSAHGTKRQETR